MHRAGGGHVTEPGVQGAGRGHTVTVGHGSGGGQGAGLGHVTAGLVVVVGVSVVTAGDVGTGGQGFGRGHGLGGGQGAGSGHVTAGPVVVVGVSVVRRGGHVGRGGQRLGGGQGAHGAGRGQEIAGHLEALGHGFGGGHSRAAVGDAAASFSRLQFTYFSTSLVTYRCNSSLASLNVKFNE